MAKSALIKKFIKWICYKTYLVQQNHIIIQSIIYSIFNIKLLSKGSSFKSSFIWLSTIDRLLEFMYNWLFQVLCADDYQKATFSDDT